MGGNRVQVFRAASLLWMWRNIFSKHFYSPIRFGIISNYVSRWSFEEIELFGIDIFLSIELLSKTNFYLILQCFSYFLFKLDCLIFFLRNYNYCKLFLPFFMLITILKMHKIKKGRVKNYRCFWIASQFFLLIEPRDELIKRNEWIRVLFGAENCAAVTCYGSLNLFLLQTPE